MSTTYADFGESTNVQLIREGDTTHLELSMAGGDFIRASLHDGCSGPSVLIDLHALITRELIERGYRGEVDTNVHNAMARRFREGVTT